MLTVCCPLTREDAVTTHFIGSRNITVALPPPDAMTLFTSEDGLRRDHARGGCEQ